MAKGNPVLSALDDIAPLDVEAFKTRRTGAGRSATVLDPALQAKLAAIIIPAGGMMGAKFFTSTTAETEAFNDARVSNAKKNGTEAPTAYTVEQHAAYKARKDAAKFTAYVNAIAEGLDPVKTVSLRVRNEGGNPNLPNMRWAFVLVNPRERKPKAS